MTSLTEVTTTITFSLAEVMTTKPTEGQEYWRCWIYHTRLLIGIPLYIMASLSCTISYILHVFMK